MMKKLAIALAGSTCLTIGATMVPATAASFSYDYGGSISGDILFGHLLSNYFDLPKPDFEFSESFSGSANDLDELNLLLGESDADSSFWSSVVAYSVNYAIPDASQYTLYQGGIDINGNTNGNEINLEKYLEWLFKDLDSDTSPLFKINVSGTLNSEIGTTDFDLNYDNNTNAIAIGNVDTNVVNSCQTGICTIDNGNWSWELSTRPINELDSESGAMGLNLSIPLAKGEGDFTLASTPQTNSTSVPEPATWLGLLAIGGWTIKRKVEQVQAG